MANKDLNKSSLKNNLKNAQNSLDKINFKELTENYNNMFKLNHNALIAALEYLNSLTQNGSESDKEKNEQLDSVQEKSEKSYQLVTSIKTNLENGITSMDEAIKDIESGIASLKDKKHSRSRTALVKFNNILEAIQSDLSLLNSMDWSEGKNFYTILKKTDKKIVSAFFFLKPAMLTIRENDTAGGENKKILAEMSAGLKTKYETLNETLLNTAKKFSQLNINSVSPSDDSKEKAIDSVKKEITSVHNTLAKKLENAEPSKENLASILKNSAGELHKITTKVIEISSNKKKGPLKMGFSKSTDVALLLIELEKLLKKLSTSLTPENFGKYKSLHKKLYDAIEKLPTKAELFPLKKSLLKFVGESFFPLNESTQKSLSRAENSDNVEEQNDADPKENANNSTLPTNNNNQNPKPETSDVSTQATDSSQSTSVPKGQNKKNNQGQSPDEPRNSSYNDLSTCVGDIKNYLNTINDMESNNFQALEKPLQLISNSLNKTYKTLDSILAEGKRHLFIIKKSDSVAITAYLARLAKIVDDGRNATLKIYQANKRGPKRWTSFLESYKSENNKLSDTIKKLQSTARFSKEPINKNLHDLSGHLGSLYEALSKFHDGSSPAQNENNSQNSENTNNNSNTPQKNSNPPKANSSNSSNKSENVPNTDSNNTSLETIVPQDAMSKLSGFTTSLSGASFDSFITSWQICLSHVSELLETTIHNIEKRNPAQKTGFLKKSTPEEKILKNLKELYKLMHKLENTKNANLKSWNQKYTKLTTNLKSLQSYIQNLQDGSTLNASRDSLEDFCKSLSALLGIINNKFNDTTSDSEPNSTTPPENIHFVGDEAIESAVSDSDNDDNTSDSEPNSTTSPENIHFVGSEAIEAALADSDNDDNTSDSEPNVQTSGQQGNVRQDLINSARSSIENATNIIKSINVSKDDLQGALKSACENLDSVREPINKLLNLKRAKLRLRSNSEAIYALICTLSDSSKRLCKKSKIEKKTWSSYYKNTSKNIGKLTEQIKNLANTTSLGPLKTELGELATRFSAVVIIINDYMSGTEIEEQYLPSSDQDAVDDSYSNIPDDLDTVIERAGNQFGFLSKNFRQNKNMLQGAYEELQKVADSINKHLTENNKTWNRRSKSQEIYNSICILLNDLNKLIYIEKGNLHSAWSEFCKSSETTFKNLRQSIGQLKKGARLYQQKNGLLDLVKKFETFVKKMDENEDSDISVSSEGSSNDIFVSTTESENHSDGSSTDTPYSESSIKI